ncbi:hypothetical protein [Saccharothrix hoggarensis]|uniref:Uncharacterized protein n=1 Tax=Saccharothrix hoggarensis TaxID=913853 RepID=A0ABW3QRQ5_9PSEU
MTHREIRITLPPGLPNDRYTGVKDAVSSLLGLWDIPVSCLESFDTDSGPPAAPSHPAPIDPTSADTAPANAAPADSTNAAPADSGTDRADAADRTDVTQADPPPADPA